MANTSDSRRGAALRHMMNGVSVVIALVAAVTLLSAATPQANHVTDLSAALGPEVEVETLAH